MLEAATILVHLSPGSLPEDKSLWPAAVSPASHPMPSISFNDSRFISRQGTALSLSQQQRAQQQQQQQQQQQMISGGGAPGSSSSSSGSPLPPIGASQQQQQQQQQAVRHPSPGGASNASGEETSAEGGSSPPSSLEEDGAVDDDGDLEMDFGEDDVHPALTVAPSATTTARRQQLVAARKTRSGKVAGPHQYPPVVVASPPQLAGARRTSFGAVTAVMGSLALGSSVPKASSPLTQPSSFGQQPSLGGPSSFAPGSYHSGGLGTPGSFHSSVAAGGTPGSYSPHYAALGSFLHSPPPPSAFAAGSLARSFSGPNSFGAQPSYSPYSTSPALPHPSSSLRGGGGAGSYGRGGGAFDPDADEDDDDDEEDDPRARGQSSPYPPANASRFHGVVEEEEDEGPGGAGGGDDGSSSSRRPAKEGSGERDDVFAMDDMEL